MTPRSFWIILLKLVGVWVLIHAIDVVAQFFNVLYHASPSGMRFENWEVVLISLILLLVYIALVRLLVFRPDIIIEKLKLDKRFEEEQFSLNIHRSTVVAIAIIIVGSLMIMETLPVFFREVYFYYRSQSFDQMGPHMDLTTMLFDLGKILIGYLLVVNNRMVVNFIEKTRREPAQPEEDEHQATEETASKEGNEQL
ncbi:hypothetical protein [Mucilaginibacter psychrotolerans]|uniref:Uncharacterized protein n=1 Tax=Mucilaginibacter psychrotolerans TaxID=1524096 RepID=A0A4Y8SR96_9SPHI|nr:hypothetical protein [Mucilaginibacter psychrotolerans]TFF40977.1 hypothetical protein E2R66_02025 [Mucilaginibacter psychrotolerans]